MDYGLQPACSGSHPIALIGLIALPVLAAFHTSLQHETIHGHPTPFHGLNELLVSLPLGAVFPFRRYRDLHLKHHNDMNLTDPYEDPESYFWPLCEYFDNATDHAADIQDQQHIDGPVYDRACADNLGIFKN